MQTGKNQPIAKRTEVLKQVQAYQISGQYRQAAALCQKMLETTPNDWEFVYLLGSFMSQIGDHKTAITILNKAIALKPDLAEAYFNIGNSLEAVGQYQLACTAFQKAIELRPKFVDAYYNLACVLKKTFHGTAAVQVFRQVFAIDKNHIGALSEAPSVFLNQGYSDEAKEYLDRLYALTKDPAAAISSDMILPSIVPSKEVIPGIRQKFADAMDKYATSDIRISKPQTHIRRTSFRLAYHGLNNKELMKKQSAMYRNVSPQLNFTAPHCTDKNYYPKKDKKLRIGFVSKYFYEHSVSLCYNRMIEAMAARGDCEIFLISTEQLGLKDQSIEGVYKAVKQELRLPNNIEKAQQIVTDSKFDILIYTEIGMDMMSYCLAHARLAPIQAVLPGHPDTTGISTVDYYLSCVHAEPEVNAQANYSEELLTFSDIVQCFERTPIPANFKSRAELSLPEDKNIYSCPMKMFKIHPDFDIAMQKILAKDPNGIILLFRDVGIIPDLLMDRLGKTMTQEQIARVKIVPWAKKEDFLSYIHHSDVIIDPFHFGGGTTCYMVFAIGTPMVTWPGDSLTGRCAISCYHRMGFYDLVAKNFEDYVDIAVKVATDKPYRNKLKKKILDTCDTLFKNDKIVDELMDKMQEVAKQKGVLK